MIYRQPATTLLINRSPFTTDGVAVAHPLLAAPEVRLREAADEACLRLAAEARSALATVVHRSAAAEVDLKVRRPRVDQTPAAAANKPGGADSWDKSAHTAHRKMGCRKHTAQELNSRSWVRYIPSRRSSSPALHRPRTTSAAIWRIERGRCSGASGSVEQLSSAPQGRT